VAATDAGAMRRARAEAHGRPRVRWAAAGLALGFLGLNAALLLHGGIRLGGDSSRYLRAAEGVLQGRLPLGYYYWAYGTYSAVVAAMQAIGAGLPGVVGVQIGIAAVAGIALASMSAALGGPMAAAVGAAVLLLNPDVARWHAYILTDSLYISAVAIGAWVVWRAGERGGVWYGFALLVLIPAAFLRPQGLVLLPVAGAFWIVRGVVARKWAGVGLGCVIVAAVLLLAFSPRVHKTMSPIPGSLLRSGRVIYGESVFRREMPRDATLPRTGWLGPLRYVVRYPGASLDLGARRVAVELAHVRPYYRPMHNLLIAAVLLPLYALAVAGVAATWRHPLTLWLLALVGAHMLLVAATLADHDGRFLLHVLGPIAVLAGAGFAHVACRAGPRP
jgi:hypothetical protein